MPTSALRELFIYYRVRPDDTAPALAVVIAFQSGLSERHPHLRTRLLRRMDVIDGLQTWMETYSSDAMHDTPGISAELQAEIETGAAALEPFVEGTRHTEVFIACV